MKYVICVHPNIKGIVDEVNERLSQGWRLHGDLLVANFEAYGVRLVQAMVYGGNGPTNEDIAKATSMYS